MQNELDGSAGVTEMYVCIADYIVKNLRGNREHTAWTTSKTLEEINDY